MSLDRRSVILRTSLLLAGSMSCAIALLCDAGTPVFAQTESRTETPTETPTQAGQQAEPTRTASLSADQALVVDVREILERHCASCHERTKLKSLRPEGAIGAITDLDWLAGSDLVVPGDPDLSKLYSAFFLRHAPQVIFSPLGRAAGPTSQDISRIREWISELTPPPTNACQHSRLAVPPVELARIAIAYLSARSEVDRPYLRFLSLTHLHAACVPAAELAGYGRAIGHLINSLTWRPGRFEPVGIAVDKTLPEVNLLFAFDLRDLGWSRDLWEQLTRDATAPRFQKHARSTETLSKLAQSSVPILNADSFAAVAMWPKHYAGILRLPEQFGLLARILGAVPEELAAEAESVEIKKSALTGLPRRLSTFGGRTTRLWMARDMGKAAKPAPKPSENTTDNVTDQSGQSSQPAQSPQSTERGQSEKGQPLSAQQTKVHFRLPSGAVAFAIYGHEEQLIVDPYARSDQPMGCRSCHGDGPRTSLTPGKAAGLSVADTAGTSASSQPVANGVGRTEIAEYLAQVRADRKPVRPVVGLDPIEALIAAFERPLDLRRAAAEYGTGVDVFTGVLSELIADGNDIARRLSLGVLSRSAFARLMKELDGGRAKPFRTVVDLSEADGGVSARTVLDEIVVWSARETYPVGAAIAFHVAVTGPCFPTVVNIDARGQAITLYPNAFERQEKLLPGRVLTIPRGNTGYSLRVRVPGNERVFAFCSEEPGPIFANDVDFVQQVFTIHGPWTEFLEKTSMRYREALTEGELRSARKARARRVERWSRRRRRRRGVKPSPVPDHRPRALIRAGATYLVLPD